MMVKIERQTSGTIAALGSGEGSPGALEAAGPVILEVSGKYGSWEYDSPPIPSENKEISLPSVLYFNVSAKVPIERG